MEDRRSSPQGLFLSLKSLFISTQPLNVEIEKLRFFEACSEHFKETAKRQCYDTANFTTPFPQLATRCIWCHIQGKVVERQPSRKYTLSYTIYRPDGTVLY